MLNDIFNFLLYHIQAFLQSYFYNFWLPYNYKGRGLSVDLVLEIAKSIWN